MGRQYRHYPSGAKFNMIVFINAIDPHSSLNGILSDDALEFK